MLETLLADLRSTMPPARDPRWRQLGLHACFLAYALSTPLFRRTGAQYAAGLGATILADFAFQYARQKRLFFPLSAVITSLGIELLCRAASPWTYAALGAAAMAGKNLLQARGRHVFNPSNAVLVASLLLLPPALVQVPWHWGGSPAGLAAAALAGLIVIVLAGRLTIVASYAASFLCGAWFLHAGRGMSVPAAVAPMAGPLFPIFAFFMVPDPRTTPSGTRGAALFGVLLGAAQTLLRAAGAFYAPFYALFLLTLSRGVFPDAFAASARQPAPAR